MSQAKAYSLMEAYYQVYIEDVNETLDEVTGRGAIDPASNFPNQRERNTRTYADAGMAMTPLERAMRRVKALQSRNDPAANKRANQITNRFIKPTERGVLRAIDAGNTASYNERNKFRESVNYESFDLYDLVLDYLISEGIAETEDNAIQIMSSMSDEWRDEIVDTYLNEADIRSIQRNGETIYKKPKNQDREETDTRRKQGRERHPSPFVYNGDSRKTIENRDRKSLKRLNAADNAEVRYGNYGDLDFTDSDFSTKSAYRTVPTDHSARRRRASGR